MVTLPNKLRERLERLESQALRRELSSQRLGYDFSSNDYLGFSLDPILRQKIDLATKSLPVGSTGSRLLRGHSEPFQILEDRAAAFCNREAALFFPSGYQANLALYSSLLGEGDIVFSDQYNHASIVDGLRLSRAERVIYNHLDLKDLREKLKPHHLSSERVKVIATESLFSMDGDFAPLRELVELAKEFSCLLVVDEAHATGLFRSGVVQSLGLTEDVFASLHAGGKALGVAGAWIATSQQFKEYLINFSRPFIYSTAPQPSLAVSLAMALEHWESVGLARAEKLRHLSEDFRTRIGVTGTSPIVPIIIGDNAKALRSAGVLQEKGFDVRAIRPPTVPQGTARLRVTLHSEVDRSVLDHLIHALRELK